MPKRTIQEPLSPFGDQAVILSPIQMCFLAQTSTIMTRRPSREAALTDVGRIRDHNEDNMGVLLSENLYIVADGMGGHAAGEVASQIAVDAVIDFFKLSKAKEEDEGADADGGDL